MRIAGGTNMAVTGNPFVLQTVGTDVEREMSSTEVLSLFEPAKVSTRHIQGIIEDYASERFGSDPLAEESFLSSCIDGHMSATAYKAAVDVIVLSIAAIPSALRLEKNFDRLVESLEVAESDDAIREMKLSLARALIEAECDSIADPAVESVYRARMSRFIAAIC